MAAIAQIKDALIRLHTGIKGADGSAVSGALADLDSLLAAHRSEIDPRLAHFLEGRSYAKALAWLGGGAEFGPASNPPGGCVPRGGVVR